MHDTNVVDFYQFGSDDFRAIIKSKDDTTVYSSQVSPEGTWCACLGFRFRGNCSHLKILLQTIFNRGIIMKDISKFYATSIKGLNSVLSGGIPVGSIMGLYGMPKCGKSTTSIWSLLDVMKLRKGDGLYVDTEMGIAQQFMPDLLKRYNARFDTDMGLKHSKLNYKSFVRSGNPIQEYKTLYDDGKEQQIHVVDIPTIQQLGLLVGKPFKLDLEAKKPKLMPFNSQVFEYIWDSPLSRLLDDPTSDSDYKSVGFVIDSLTNVSKEFGTANQNFPVRDTAQSIILNQLSQTLSEFEDMVGMLLFHASSDPTKGINADSKPVGGKSVGHSCKTMVQFSNPTQKGLNTEIVITPYRLPTKISRVGATITISDNGVF